MKRLLLIGCTLLTLTTYAQKVFFTSPHTFEASELETFYASIRQQGNVILFNAPDYRLYAFDKTTGAEKWSQYIKRKSNRAPFFVGDRIWAKAGDHMVQLDTATGEKVKDLVFETVDSEPVAKDGLLYFTGIYGGGCLFAYEPQKDSIIWRRFIAHGISQKPYYLKDKIIANAEGINWLEFNYAGQMKDAACETSDDQFPSQSSCVKEFSVLSHDGKPIAGKLAQDLSLDEYTVPDVLTTTKHTFVLGNQNEQLTIFGNKLKKKVQIELFNLSEALAEFNTDSLTYKNESLTKLLKANDTHVWIVYYHHLLIYNHAKKTLDRLVDLSAWEPHQVLMDDNNLWIISKKDGRLYGVGI